MKKGTQIYAHIRHRNAGSKTNNLQKKCFVKYANKYNSDIETKCEIDREWYVYKKANEKGLENTNIEKLLDMVLDDIQHQYAVKHDIESRVGFALALWGVLVVAILEKDLFIQCIKQINDSSNSMWFKFFCCISFLGLILSVIVTLILIIATLRTNKYNRPLYGEDKDKYFRCAVDDKLMSLVHLLDTNINVWKHNERTNQKKSKIFDFSILAIGVMIAFIILSYIFASV